MQQNFLERSNLWLKDQISKLRKYLETHPSLAYILAGAAGLVVVSILFTISLLLMVYAGLWGKLPKSEDLKAIDQYTATEVFSSDGQLLGKYYLENRTNLAYEEIPTHLIECLIAIEDKRFYEHSGVDWRAWFRVFFKTLLFQMDSGGGSTITQQLAKNLYPRKNLRIASLMINKLREIFIAQRLESVYSKEEILTLYLNTVPFPENIYGLDVASRRFFQKPPISLHVEEAATLVGTLKANAWYNPVKHADRCLNRRNLVIQLWKEQFTSDTSGLDSLLSLPLSLKYNRESHDEGTATYFRAFLRQELPTILDEIASKSGKDYNLYTDGLKIFTTVDSRLQILAEDALSDHLHYLQTQFDRHWSGKKPWARAGFVRDCWRKTDTYKQLLESGLSSAELDSLLHQPRSMIIFTPEGDRTVEWSPADSIVYYNGILHGGMLALDAQNGAVKAWAGGLDHRFFQYDQVMARRQTGSVFKPFVFAAALEYGIKPCDYFANEQMIYPEQDDWQPANADGEYGGLYSMAGALQHSINVVTVELLYEVGLERVRQLAIDAGLPNQIPRVPSIALGTASMSLFDLLPAYGIFVNDGIPLEAYCIDSIQNESGETIYRGPKLGTGKTSVLTAENAKIMTSLMESVVDSGTAMTLRTGYGVDMNLAGKTGTTQSHADGWFVGYTPNLIIGSRVGANLPSVHFRNLDLGQGAHTALPICGRFLSDIEKDQKLQGYTRGRFSSLPDSLAQTLDCPAWLADDPSFLEDIFLAEQLEALLNIFRKKDDRREIGRTHDRNDRYSERIRKKNERTRKRRARKKQREEFFDQLFKKDN